MTPDYKPTQPFHFLIYTLMVAALLMAMAPDNHRPVERMVAFSMIFVFIQMFHILLTPLLSPSIEREHRCIQLASHFHMQEPTRERTGTELE